MFSFLNFFPVLYSLSELALFEKAESADRSKSTCKVEESPAAVTDGPNAGGAAEQVDAEANEALAKSDTEVNGCCQNLFNDPVI